MGMKKVSIVLVLDAEVWNNLNVNEMAEEVQKMVETELTMNYCVRATVTIENVSEDGKR